MDLRDTPEEAAFRAEVRAWLEENIPSEMTGPRSSEAEYQRAWHEWSRRLAAQGYAGLTWPQEYGGSAESGFAGSYRAWTALVVKHLGEAVEDGDLPGELNLRYEATRLGTMVAGLGLLSGTDLATNVRFNRRARKMLADHLAVLRTMVAATG